MDPNNTNAGSSVPSSPPTEGNQSALPVTSQPAVTTQDTAQNPLATPPVVPIGPKPDASAPGATNGIPQPSPSAVAPTTPPPGSTGTQTATANAPVTPPLPHKGKPMLWVIVLLIFAFFCGLLLAAWYFQTQLQKVSPGNQATQTTVTTPTAIVIGTDATFPPMEYTASEGALIGYDIDLGNRIGEEWGVPVSYKNVPWDELFKALDNKQIDIILSSVTITEERSQQYDFSEPYLNAGQVIITRASDTSIIVPENLQGKRIAVQQETTNETEALKLTSQNLVIRYPDFLLATQALVEGKVDAILSDLPGAKGIITKNPTLKIASDPFTNEYYGIVFRKGDPNVAKINEILSSLRTQGVLTDLKQKWLD